jgi:hypothetical protein
MSELPTHQGVGDLPSLEQKKFLYFLTKPKRSQSVDDERTAFSVIELK